MAEHAEDWTVWEERIHPDASVDQATAKYIGDDGVFWIHTYLVWPHLTIYATISGPTIEVLNQNIWAMNALKSIRLTVH
jgi:hypothetical protein